MPASARPAKPEKDRRDAVVNLRLPVKTRELIDSAAAASGKSRTQFVLDSARQVAIDILLDQRLLSLPSRSFDAFVAILNDPPKPNRKLKALMRGPSPWDD